MTDKLNITIKLAELPPIPLQIKRDEEPVIRSAEYNVNSLWTQWRQRFSDKSAFEVLAMVAFQFAKVYEMQNNRVKQAEQILDDFEKQLDSLLINIDANNPSDN